MSFAMWRMEFVFINFSLHVYNDWQFAIISAGQVAIVTFILYEMRSKCIMYIKSHYHYAFPTKQLRLNIWKIIPFWVVLAKRLYLFLIKMSFVGEYFVTAFVTIQF